MRWWGALTERADTDTFAPPPADTLAPVAPQALVAAPDPALAEALRVVARAGYFTVEDCDAHCESCGAPMPWNVIRGPFVNRTDAP